MTGCTANSHDRARAILSSNSCLRPLQPNATNARTAIAVRETVLEQLHDEVPYAVAVQVEEFREGRSPLYIRAVIYVERDSQKAIIIGSKGAQIRSIGEAARKKIEAFLGTRVYLDLWVKVLANWRKNPGSLSRFGYQLATGKSK